MDQETAAMFTKIFLDLIPNNVNLAAVYQAWTVMDPADKLRLDCKALVLFPTEGQLIYTPLIEAFKQWDTLQDTQGAGGCPSPGYDCETNPLSHEDVDCIIALVLTNIKIIVEQRRTKEAAEKAQKAVEEASDLLKDVNISRDDSEDEHTPSA